MRSARNLVGSRAQPRARMITAAHRTATIALLLTLVACGGGGGGGGGGGSKEPPINMTLTGTAVTPYRIDVSWTSASATRYDLYRDGTFLGSSSGTFAPITGLTPSTRYCFVVYADYFPTGIGGRSNEACATTPADHPPTTAGGLTVTVVSPARIDLTWTAASDDWGISGYRITRDGAPLTTVAATAYRDGTASPAGTHCYTITALDTGGNASAPSAQACATTPADTQPPSAPTGLYAIAGDTTVALSWNASTDNGAVASYLIYRDGVKAQTLPAVSGVGPVQWTDADRATYTQYCYQVVAVDSANNASSPSDLACATTTWQRDVIVAATLNNYAGEHNALAIDAGGKLHVGYSLQSWRPATRDYGPMELHYADNVSGAWSDLAVSSTLSAQDRVSIVVDASGHAHLGFTDAGNGHPQYAQAGNAWQVESVAPEVGYGASLALDSNSTARIVFGRSTALRYASRATGAWSVVDVPGVGTSFEPALGLDSLGRAHVVYLGPASQSLGYASDVGGSWSTATIEPTSAGGWSYPALAIDGSGAVHVSYHDGANGGLKYATDKSGVWQTTVVDSASAVGGMTSIAIDAAGAVHIAYIDYGNSRLKYATNVGGSWHSFDLDNAGIGTHSWGDTSIGIDRNGRIYIVYFSGSALRYTTRP